MKEYHIWDALFIESCKKYLVKNIEEQTLKGVKLTPEEFERKKDLIALRFLVQSDSLPYEQYFAELISGKFNLTGDVTPAYAGLKAETFALIRKRLESVGFKVKVVFLMRDPVERCLSAARMNSRKRQSESVSERLKATYSSERMGIRTNYHRTIHELDKVFDSQDVYCGIFEEMFTASSIEKLSNFCGVPTNYAFGLEIVNSGNGSSSIDLALRKEVSNYYSDAYKFCNERFPQTELLWKSHFSD